MGCFFETALKPGVSTGNAHAQRLLLAHQLRHFSRVALGQGFGNFFVQCRYFFCAQWMGQLHLLRRDWARYRRKVSVLSAPVRIQLHTRRGG